MFQGLQSGCVLPQMLSFRDVLEIPLTDEQIKNPQVPENLDLLRAERMICSRWIMFPSFEVSHALTWDDLGILVSGKLGLHDSWIYWLPMEKLRRFSPPKFHRQGGEFFRKPGPDSPEAGHR